MHESSQNQYGSASVLIEGNFDSEFSGSLKKVLQESGAPASVRQLGRSGLVIEFEAVSGNAFEDAPVQTSAGQLALIATILREARTKTRYTGRADQGSLEFAAIRRIVSNRYFSLVIYKALFPSSGGQPPRVNDFHVIRWSEEFPAGATAIPITVDGRILLTREMNPAFGLWSWKLPTGSREPGEDFGECALREGQEEAGLLTTIATKILPLGDVAVDPTVTFDGAKLVLITDVEVGKRKTDGAEAIEAARAFTLVEVEEMIQRGEIFDAFSLSGLCRLQILLRRHPALRKALSYALDEDLTL